MIQTTIDKPQVGSSTFATPVQVAGLGTFAPQSFTQGQLLDQLGLLDDEFAISLAATSGIESRNFSAPIAEWYKGATLDTQADYFREQAPLFAAKALQAAAANAIELCELDAVIAVTSSGYMMPGVAETLCGKYGIGRLDGLRYDLVGQGCVAIIPAIQMARSLLASNEAQRVAVVCTEPHAALYNPDAEGKSRIVQQLLFGEGASALILERPDGRPGRLPTFIDFQQQLVENTFDIVGVKQGSVWRTTLEKEVPSVVENVVGRLVSRILSRNGLSLPQIKHWAYHTGGKRILEICQSELSLTAEQMAPSFDVLREHGNMGSSSAGFTLQRITESENPKPGDYGMMVSVGPGLILGAALMRWES